MLTIELNKNLTRHGSIYIAKHRCNTGDGKWRCNTRNGLSVQSDSMGCFDSIWLQSACRSCQLCPHNRVRLTNGEQTMTEADNRPSLSSYCNQAACSVGMLWQGPGSRHSQTHMRVRTHTQRSWLIHKVPSVMYYIEYELQEMWPIQFCELHLYKETYSSILMPVTQHENQRHKKNKLLSAH